jgi:glycosyltransferase involved in cell wall biosynthesis
MRILYDHQVFSLQNAGGASRYHYELVRNMQLVAGVEIEMLLGLNGSVMPFAGLRRRHSRIVATSTRLKPGVLRYAANEFLSALVAPMSGKFDIYHPTLYRALPWVRGHRVVVTHHDCTHERFPSMFRNADSIIRAKRKLFSRASAIICVSESSRRDLLHFYDIPPEKAHVVYHGFTPLPSPARASTGRPQGAPYLLYVGSRSQYKNFGLLLEAFALSGLAGGYRLLVVGGGPFSGEEQTKIDSLGLGTSVLLVASADETVLADAYRYAALFVYPSLYEGFGFPPLEAMSLGCPVLVHRTSSLPEVCGDAAFYFDSPDADTLARALVSSLEDAPGRALKRQLGEQQVREFDWKTTADQTLRIYRLAAS